MPPPQPAVSSRVLEGHELAGVAKLLVRHGLGKRRGRVRGGAGVAVRQWHGNTAWTQPLTSVQLCQTCDAAPLAGNRLASVFSTAWLNGGQVGGRAGRQAGRQAGGQACGQAGRRVGRGRWGGCPHPEEGGAAGQRHGVSVHVRSDGQGDVAQRILKAAEAGIGQGWGWGPCSRFSGGAGRRRGETRGLCGCRADMLWKPGGSA